MVAKVCDREYIPHGDQEAERGTEGNTGQDIFPKDTTPVTHFLHLNPLPKVFRRSQNSITNWTPRASWGSSAYRRQFIFKPNTNTSVSKILKCQIILI
jgi:hypothetical protein